MEGPGDRCRCGCPQVFSPKYGYLCTHCDLKKPPKGFPRKVKRKAKA